MNTDLQANGSPLDASVLLTLPARRRDSNKGDFGNVGVLGGAAGMTGALLLAARAALYLGAGKVYAASLTPALVVDFMQPELMLKSLDDFFVSPLNVLVVGPGLGQSDAAHAVLVRALQHPATLVLDADALNLLAASAELKKALLQRSAPILLTPHPGEATRLLACDVPTVQHDRPQAALQLAQQYRAWVVLKGAGSICAAPDGSWRLNPTGNPGMSSAGIGDVLSGMLAALLAQRMTPFEALQLGVYLHSAAADALVARGLGPVGLTASEVLLEARALLNRARNVDNYSD
jgi:hydroxyethylthiazole kinase-like uncharacterized protein yjeF